MCTVLFACTNNCWCSMLFVSKEECLCSVLLASTNNCWCSMLFVSKEECLRTVLCVRTDVLSCPMFSVETMECLCATLCVDIGLVWSCGSDSSCSMKSCSPDGCAGSLGTGPGVSRQSGLATSMFAALLVAIGPASGSGGAASIDDVASEVG